MNAPGRRTSCEPRFTVAVFGTEPRRAPVTSTRQCLRTGYRPKSIRVAVSQLLEGHRSRLTWQHRAVAGPPLKTLTPEPHLRSTRRTRPAARGGRNGCLRSSRRTRAGSRARSLGNPRERPRATRASHRTGGPDPGGLVESVAATTRQGRRTLRVRLNTSTSATTCATVASGLCSAQAPASCR